MKNKLLLITLCFMCSVLLAGCGGGGPGVSIDFTTPIDLPPETRLFWDEANWDEVDWQ